MKSIRRAALAAGACTVVFMVGGFCHSVGAEIVDNFAGEVIDPEKWERSGTAFFSQSDGQLYFPCKDDAKETLVSRRTFSPGFFQITFQSYSSTNRSIGGAGLGSYAAIGLSADQERVRMIRGDIGAGGYFEANHFIGNQYNLWYTNTNADAGRLGLYYDGADVYFFYSSDQSRQNSWRRVGPAIAPGWTSPPKLYLGGNAGASGCTTFAIKSVEFFPAPLPASLLEMLGR